MDKQQTEAMFHARERLHDEANAVYELYYGYCTEKNLDIKATDNKLVRNEHEAHYIGHGYVYRCETMEDLDKGFARLAQLREQLAEAMSADAD